MYCLVLLSLLFFAGSQATKVVPDYVVPVGSNLEIQVTECNTWEWYHNDVQLEGNLLISLTFSYFISSSYHFIVIIHFLFCSFLHEILNFRSLFFLHQYHFLIFGIGILNLFYFF